METETVEKKRNIMHSLFLRMLGVWATQYRNVIYGAIIISHIFILWIYEDIS